VTRNQNSRVRTVGVYQSCGFVILTTIAVTTQTNQLTCVDNGTARLDGKDVRERPITGAYRNGCSATVRMIAATVQTSCQRTVRNVKRPRTISAKTIDVYLRDGCVTLRTTVVTTQMNRKTCAKDCTDSVRSLSSSVPMVNVYRVSGGVTTMTIAVITRMNSTVVDSSVRMAPSSARVAIA